MATLLETAFRTNGDAAAVEREVIGKLRDGSLVLTGIFRGCEAELVTSPRVSEADAGGSTRTRLRVAGAAKGDSLWILDRRNPNRRAKTKKPLHMRTPSTPAGAATYHVASPVTLFLALLTLLLLTPGAASADHLRPVHSPDNQAAVGAIEAAVGDLEAAVNDGLLDAEQGISLMDQLARAASQLALEAIDFAIAAGGDPQVINDAEQALADGDALRAVEAFKDAVSKYKDALAKAESA